MGVCVCVCGSMSQLKQTNAYSISTELCMKRVVAHSQRKREYKPDAHTHTTRTTAIHADESFGLDIK